MVVSPVLLARPILSIPNSFGPAGSRIFSDMELETFSAPFFRLQEICAGSLMSTTRRSSSGQIITYSFDPDRLRRTFMDDFERELLTESVQELRGEVEDRRQSLPPKNAKTSSQISFFQSLAGLYGAGVARLTGVSGVERFPFAEAAVKAKEIGFRYLFSGDEKGHLGHVIAAVLGLQTEPVLGRLLAGSRRPIVPAHKPIQYGVGLMPALALWMSPALIAGQSALAATGHFPAFFREDNGSFKLADEWKPAKPKRAR